MYVNKIDLKLNWFEIYSKIKSTIKKYYWIAGIPLLVFGFFASESEKHEIKQHRSETYGTVYFTRPVYNKPSKRYYDYEFTYNGSIYRGSSMEYLSKKIGNGKIYIVEFSNQNPKHNRMIFETEYSMQIHSNPSGKIDTIFIPTDELNRKIPTYIKNRIDSLKIEN